MVAINLDRFVTLETPNREIADRIITDYPGILKEYQHLIQKVGYRRKVFTFMKMHLNLLQNILKTYGSQEYQIK